MPRGSTASTAEDASTSVDRRRRPPRDSDPIIGPITATRWRPAARRSPRRAAAQTYGCLYSVDKRVPLGLDGFNAGSGGQSLDNFRLAGPYVAFGCVGNLIHGCWVGVDVVDLRDGPGHRPNLDTSLGGAFGSGAGRTHVELKDNGSVAWIAGRDAPGKSARSTRTASAYSTAEPASSRTH